MASKPGGPAIEGLIEYVAKSLVDDPTQVKVRRRETGSSTIIELRVAAQDTGRIIGKNGRLANALRTLLYTAEADTKARRVILKIV
ncbi:MAG TPA: KH domain-containing protein [Candidatus Limnocylindrales bacterium]|nr:KH domain-containing protein [Candidatus Limnocylindrales bacterium]